MEKRRVPDGAGGYITTWEEGAEVESFRYLDTSMEARRAQQEGMKELFDRMDALHRHVSERGEGQSR